MRLALAGDAVRRDTGPVRTDQCRWFGGNRAHVLFRHAAHQNTGRAPISDDDVANGVDLVTAPLGGNMINRRAGFASGIWRNGDTDILPGFDPAKIVEPDLGHLLPDTRAVIGISQSFKHRVHAALLQPDRQQKAQRIGTPVIGVLVAIDINTAASCEFDRFQHTVHLSPIISARKFHMSNLDMDAAMFADVNRFGQCLVDGMGFISDMR